MTQFIALLDELVSEGVDAVSLGGGEPTLHTALPVLLEEARKRGLPAGLTTNARDPGLTMALADSGLLHSFGVSAGKGEWAALTDHPRAVINLLLLHDGLKKVTELAMQAILQGAVCLLLLGYKGSQREFAPTTDEMSTAFGLLTRLGRKAGVTIAADDYTRRRLGLIETCGEGFVRISLDGTRDTCCFPYCEYRIFHNLYSNTYIYS